MIMSMWVDMTPGKTSLIKMGSWDKYAVAEGKQMTWFKTNTKFSWEGSMKGAYVGDQVIV